MEYIIMAFLFLPILLMVGKNKEWYIVLLFVLYPILPDTFAIEFSQSLPLLTISRLILIINIFVCLWDANGTIRMRFPKEFRIFIVVSLFIAIINLHNGMDQINKIFIIILHQLCLVLVIVKFVTTKQKFFRCINYMIYGFLIDAIIGIMQTLCQIDVAKIFSVVESRQEAQLDLRMGMIRAYGLNGNTFVLSAQCAMMILVAFYMYESNMKKKYLLAAAVYAAAMICCMSRSTILSLGIVILLMLVNRFRSFCKKYIKYVPIVLIILMVVCVIEPRVYDVLINQVRSILNIFGGQYSLADNYGSNADSAVDSRMMQWSLLLYMLGEGFFTILFGYGYNAYKKGMLHFYYSGYNAWDKARALDVGFVGVLGEMGIMGLFTYIVFYCTIFKNSFAKREKNRGNLDYYKLTIYIIILFIILNITTAVINSNLFWMYIGLYYAYDTIQKKEQNDCCNGG